MIKIIDRNKSFVVFSKPLWILYNIFAFYISLIQFASFHTNFRWPLVNIYESRKLDRFYAIR